MLKASYNRSLPLTPCALLNGIPRGLFSSQGIELGVKAEDEKLAVSTGLFHLKMGDLQYGPSRRENPTPMSMEVHIPYLGTSRVCGALCGERRCAANRVPVVGLCAWRSHSTDFKLNS